MFNFLLLVVLITVNSLCVMASAHLDRDEIITAINDNGCKEAMLNMPAKQEIRKTYKLNELGGK